MGVTLIVGDVHATLEELADCQALIDGLYRTCEEHRPDRVLFLGDQLNNHSVCRVEVLDFWYRAFAGFELRKIPVDAVVGNHDLGGDGRATSMLAFRHQPGVNVIDIPGRDRRSLRDPTAWWGDTYILPYIKDRAEFVAAAAREPDQVLVCHGTFVGATYENGYPAEDGVAAEDVPQHDVISGHFHTPQQVGKVWYPGAPRWRSKSDANVDRAVWLVRIRGGRIVDRQPVDTAAWCRKRFYWQDIEGQAALRPVIDPRHDYEVDVHGSREYVAQAVAAWTARGARARGVRTDLAVVPEVRESEGVAVAFRRFLDGWRAPAGTAPEVLLEMARARLGGLV